ncbi:MAG: transcriptional repressor LexA [bacterium]
MVEGLTDRQRVVLNLLVRLTERDGRPPTIREVAKALSITVRGAYDHLQALARKGYIRLRGGSARGIDVVKSLSGLVSSSTQGMPLPILGRIPAGDPLLSEEYWIDTLSLDRSLVPDGTAFILEVVGDSMIEDHIVSGDLVLVRPNPRPENGSIVVAVIGDEATVKRLGRIDGKLALIPSNPAYSPIVLDEERGDVRLVGEVVGLIRRRFGR